MTVARQPKKWKKFTNKITREATPMRAFSCFFKDTSRATRDTVNTFFYIYHALMLRQLYEGLIDWIWRISDTVITSQKEFFFWTVKENGSGSPPIINRPISSHFKTDERLIAINKSEGQKHATSKYNLFLFPKSNSFSSLLGKPTAHANDKEPLEWYRSFQRCHNRGTMALSATTSTTMAPLPEK